MLIPVLYRKVQVIRVHFRTKNIMWCILQYILINSLTRFADLLLLPMTDAAKPVTPMKTIPESKYNPSLLNITVKMHLKEARSSITS